MRSYVLAAVALLFANESFAATISSGSLQSYATVLTAGGSAQFDFEPDQNLKVSFSVTGTGDSDDLILVTFGFLDGTSYSFDFVASSPGGGPDLAGGFLPSLTTAAPFYVRFLLDPAAIEPVGLSLSVEAEGVAIPTPAAALSLLSALAGVGMLARRRVAQG